jgi:hypothetical protein
MSDAWKMDNMWHFNPVFWLSVCGSFWLVYILSSIHLSTWCLKPDKWIIRGTLTFCFACEFVEDFDMCITQPSTYRPRCVSFKPPFFVEEVEDCFVFSETKRRLPSNDFLFLASFVSDQTCTCLMNWWTFCSSELCTASSFTS